MVLSHPFGRKWLQGLRIKDSQMVPNELPDRAALASLIEDLPLHIVEFRDEESLYCAVLQVRPFPNTEPILSQQYHSVKSRRPFLLGGNSALQQFWD